MAPFHEFSGIRILQGHTDISQYIWGTAQYRKRIDICDNVSTFASDDLSFLLFIYIFNSRNPDCFNEKDSKCCQEQTTNKLTAAVLGGISPFLLNKRKLRSGNSFTREHNGDITAENKATAIFYFFV